MLVFFIIAWLFLGLCFGYRQGFGIYVKVYVRQTAVTPRYS